jgi:ABC-type antimicrobial peptide transport system permease subunit
MNANNIEIREQVDLSNRIAFGVVMQGFRIRMGRSMITLLGVILGIAFLMSNLSNQIVRTAVRDEDAMRASVRRMMSFLSAETGPLKGLSIAAVITADLSETETRFMEALNEQGAVIHKEVNPGAVDAVVVLGSDPGTVERSHYPEHIPVAITAAVDNASVARPGFIPLSTPPTDDELAKAGADRRAARYRQWWILAISVVVTFMGITNAILMSVTERFREIGTMKCLGAKSKFIRRLFLLESLLIGGVGSVAGAIAGALFSIGINAAIYGLPMVLSLNWAHLLTAGALSTGIGAALTVVSALSPAHIAASMTPAHALRSNV